MRARVSYQKDVFSADKVSLNERVPNLTENAEETVTSECHVGTYFAKWFRCVKFIFGPDTDTARVRANTSFHLATLPRRGYHVCILNASETRVTRTKIHFHPYPFFPCKRTFACNNLRVQIERSLYSNNNSSIY